MGDTGVRQRLAAILAADVAGYSRLMASDESGTLAALDAARGVFKQRIEARQGRVIDMAGDSVLAVFESAAGAANAALEIQKQLASLSRDSAEDRRMRFRIGVHLGDVIEKSDGTVYGDGVNIAARLQALAEPGGIYVSGMVHEAVRNRVTVGFSDLGKHTVKNIAQPLSVFRVELEHQPPASGSREERKEKPSIAVLRFDVFSADADQRHLADGIVEDIITELSKLRWFHVTARNTSFTYTGESIDIRKVAQELGVRYVLEGSIRSMGPRLRITAQLIDATGGNHVWAERFDTEIAKIFELQDDIVSRIVGALGPELHSAELRRSRERPEQNLQVWDYAMRARWHATRLTKEDNETARPLLERALKLDPACVPALACLAYCNITAVFFGWSNAPGEAIAEARRAAEKALIVDESDPWAQCARGLVEIVSKQSDKAIACLERAVTLNPNFAIGYGYYAIALAYGGEPDRAIEAGQRAILLSPRDPELVHFFMAIATAHFVRGGHEAALDWAHKSIVARPVPAAYRLVAICNAYLGRMDEARKGLDEVLQRAPHLTATAIRNAIHFKVPADSERYVDGLRKAGLTG